MFPVTEVTFVPAPVIYRPSLKFVAAGPPVPMSVMAALPVDSTTPPVLRRIPTLKVEDPLPPVPVIEISPFADVTLLPAPVIFTPWLLVVPVPPVPVSVIFALPVDSTRPPENTRTP
jgi:hypothetical protein